MRRLALFVEGRTELLFIDRLVTAIAGKNNVQIEHRQIRGGSNVPKTTRILQSISNDEAEPQYYVLIVDCGGDGLVKTRIMEEHQTLSDKGYECIVGFRDVRGDFTREEIPRLEAGLKLRIKTSLVPVEFVLAVMETEAWFLSEHTHFERIDEQITLAALQARLGCDPSTEDMTLRDLPFEDMVAAYAIGNKTYKKGDAAGTIEHLDYSRVYLDLADRIPYLKKLVNRIDSFLTETSDTPEPA